MSVCPTLYVPNGVSQKNLIDIEDAHLGETTVGRLLILLVHALIWAQVSLFSCSLFHDVSIGTVMTFLFVVTMVTKCVLKVTKMRCTYMTSVANHQEQEKLFLKLQCRFLCTGSPVISMSICSTIVLKCHIIESNDKNINCSSRRDNHGKVIEFCFEN
jgi:hypothetical protein